MIPIEQFLNELIKSITLFKPETTLVISFMATIIFDLIFKKSRKVSGYVAFAGLLVTGYFMLFQTNLSSASFSKMFAVDPFALFFKFIILIAALIVIVISFFSNELFDDPKRSMGEYFALIIGMTFGMFLLSGATNLILIYLAVETMSISSYILAGYTREIKRASEASLKYVIFGAVSSGLMIYGISILYGLTGTLNLFELNAFLAANKVNIFALLIAGLMILSGIGYKISAVPFHFWTPDVYDGSPVTITALLSVASKAAGFAILIRFIKVGFVNLNDTMYHGTWQLMGGVDWKFLVAILAVATMTVGNLGAIWQNNTKRLLAYSSIAHAGYMLMSVTVMTAAGVSSVLIYFVFYLFMNLGAFYAVMLIANKIGSEDIDDYVGLGYRSPLISVCMAIFLVSLTGLPPTAGFIGKLYIFSAVIKANYIWLAVIGVLNSVVSLFYYAKIFRNMFLRGMDTTKERIQYSTSSIVILFLLVIPTLLFGVYFTPIVEWANKSISIYLGS